MVTGLSSYIARRLLESIPVIFLMIIISFVLIQVAPGDPALLLAGPTANAEVIAAIRVRYGLDKPLIDQLSLYLTNLFQGNFGTSIVFHTPVLSLIIDRLPATLLLLLTSQTLSLLIGIWLGVLSARVRGSKTDLVISMSSLTIYSIPFFWMGLILILVFALNLRWFPTSGMVSVTGHRDGIGYVLDVIWHMILPVVALSSWYIPTYVRITRAAAIEVMEEDYVNTARAKGLDENSVFMKHVLRNALLPIVTMAGLFLGFAVSGAIITEIVFGWPGMGQLLYQAAFGRDYPLLMGIFVLTSIGLVLATMFVDVLYTILDPRVTYK